MTTSMGLRFGQRQLQPGSPALAQLRDCNALLDDMPALRARMAEDGYLLVRGLYRREQVMAARLALFTEFAKQDLFDPAAPLLEGRVNRQRTGHAGAFLGGHEATALPAFRQVIEGAEIMGFFQRFLGQPALTFDYKWMRLVGPGDATGAHMDNVYMGRGSSQLYTVWTPLGDVPYAQGPLAILVGSHRLEAYARVRETYGQMDVDIDRVAGWFSDDPLELTERFGGQWASSEFTAGDALIFGMHTMHASLTNTSDHFRITSDTRYQPAADPADERWVGDRPKAHYAWHSGPQVPMQQKRQEWGV